MGQLVYPFPFCLIQSFLQPIKDHLVGGLNLPVSLRVYRGIVVVPNSKFTTISPESLAVELCSAVRYEGVRYAEPRDNVPPHEFLHVLVSDISQRLGLYPFHEIICPNEQPSLVCSSPREWAHDV